MDELVLANKDLKRPQDFTHFKIKLPIPMATLNDYIPFSSMDLVRVNDSLLDI